MKSENSLSLFLFCGERSGDIYGSGLVKALKMQRPNLNLFGVPGPKMRQEGVFSFIDMENFEVMGLSDVLSALPRLTRFFFKIRNHILRHKPDAVVMIDYPGFNLRLAKSLRKKGYQGQLIQYISPSVWAWGKERIALMQQSLDLLLTIYPFESRYFSDLKALYVGHPLIERIQQYKYEAQWKKKCHIPDTDNLISIFPGSRKGEIKRNLPIILKAMALYKQQYAKSIFGLSILHEDLFKKLIAQEKITTALKESIFLVPPEYNYELMRDSRSAIAKSGSVTLELALHRRPTVVIYQLTLLNQLYARFFLRLSLPHYCIVNILAKKEIYPELIRTQPTPLNLFQKLEQIDKDQKYRELCLQGCSQVMEELGKENSSMAASTLILQSLAAR